MYIRAALSLLVGIAGCAGASDRRAGPGVPAFALVEELRLDPNAEDFSSVMAIGVGPQGQIAVLQPQDGRVLLYDSSGSRIATIGRRGEGPGEFDFPSRVGWLGDTMWVADHQLRRTVFVAPDGSVLRTSALPRNVALRAPLAGDSRRILFFIVYGPRADGSMLGSALLEAVDESGRPQRGNSRPVVLVLAPPNGLPRIVGEPPAGDDERWYMWIGGLGRPVPFAAGPHADVAQDLSRFAYLTTEHTDASRGSYVLTAFDVQGDTILVRSYPFTGIAIPSRARDSALAAMIREPGEPREGPDLDRQFQDLARERMPSTYPPVMDLVIGLDDTYWLTVRDTGDVRRALVLDGRGDPIGTFELPPRATIRLGTRSHVWMTQRDDDDLVAVLRHRLEPARQ